jgi:hypothetical protein
MICDPAAGYSPRLLLSVGDARRDDSFYDRYDEIREAKHGEVG